MKNNVTRKYQITVSLKKSALMSVLLALLPFGVSQCTSAYRLVDYKEYCSMDELDTHITYQYENGVLYSKTEVITRSKDIVDSTVTYYDVIKSDDSIDSIETSYEYRNDVLGWTRKVVKNCNPDGIIQKKTEYEYKDDDWLERGFTLYNFKGRWIEYVMPDMYHSWCTYDSLDRRIGLRYTHIILNAPIMVDTIEFAPDGQSATFTEYLFFQKNDRWNISAKKLYRLDNKGRVISLENVPLTNDSTHNIVRTVYRHDRKGRVKTEKTFQSEYPYTESKLFMSLKHKYRFGLRTRTIEHHYHSGQKILYTFTVFKYDFRHRLLLEETDYDDRLRRDYDERKIWTYEKAK